jgi:GT2 family glycosyltransferase
MSSDVTISLVGCNQRPDLERLLPSLTVAAGLVQSQILLVDNRSTDGTNEFVSRYYPAVEITRNHRRTGYGGNHNINLKRAEGRYFVIMNSDMVVTRDVFAALRNYMADNLDVGIVSPKILNEDGSIQGLNKRFPTLLDLFLRRFVPEKYKCRVRNRLDYYEMRDVGYDQICDVPFLSGAFMCCRTDLLRSMRGFDPEYFLYFEDVDLCRRVQRTHRTVYYPYACVTHFWRRSAHRSWIHSYYFVRSACRYFNHWGYKLY